MPTLMINGQPHSVDVDADTPLLWVLRDILGLNAAKFGCGIAQCGACTVYVDGKAVRACNLPVGLVGERAITTPEGLDMADPIVRAIKSAWVELDVVQCGYCQPGQVMAAVALLRTTPNPTDEQIDSAMSGNMCRCGTYMRIRAAIHHAAGELA
ncbi:(2Fe-2S)-binding protein [Acetobacter pasteurianus]|uniref:Isoquinoline 1-oxidoreductase n=1 Tax=Acetobacter pasteurianus TaxID=438 RepID=A0A1A0D718_ACEPA|nr:(2Fe-2S)-binding protein [Acetobacter pasteurianus]OAZ70840.1 Isoquinoline 1-oxidoreductase [Acetobacter pasteurianus]RCL05010.1 (2Fe-2S)-binding protein [Acetobacter pasteurianus]GAB30070.1 aldehyde dehydrogenase small subunit [Acetobacter pasteurianus subsp. pasteurianus LMG 1262 = NBRC 106471]GCD48891.1 membrane-bound aldehyde dehydrogenase small subunit [Acetobacter pasteurianus subsp. pasteurianus LMG 1262 = NBRC 106471]GCD55149.1 membrane-bound aldehyde dehydrogenase small subunit [Ac